MPVKSKKPVTNILAVATFGILAAFSSSHIHAAMNLSVQKILDNPPTMLISPGYTLAFGDSGPAKIYGHDSCNLNPASSWQIDDSNETNCINLTEALHKPALANIAFENSDEPTPLDFHGEKPKMVFLETRKISDTRNAVELVVTRAFYANGVLKTFPTPIIARTAEKNDAPIASPQSQM